MRAQLIERTHTFCTFKLSVVRRTEGCSQACNPALSAQPSVVTEQINKKRKYNHSKYILCLWLNVTNDKTLKEAKKINYKLNKGTLKVFNNWTSSAHTEVSSAHHCFLGAQNEFLGYQLERTVWQVSSLGRYTLMEVRPFLQKKKTYYFLYE